LDVSVKGELVSGLLTASGGDNCTIVLSSHDIGEFELLADWVGFLGEQSIQLSEPAEVMRTRFKHVDVMLESDIQRLNTLPADWLSVEQAARHLKFVASSTAPDFEHAVVRAQLPDAVRVEIREASLKEVFVAFHRSERARKLATIEAGRA
jgi:ABC-type multidrug transport system ATPase subunit